MKAKFTGSQQEFDEFYQHLRKQQSAGDKQVVFLFEVETSDDIINGAKQLSFSNDDDFNDDCTDGNDIFHTQNREWLTAKLAEADEEIDAGRTIPSNKALFDDVIARGKKRLNEGKR